MSNPRRMRHSADQALPDWPSNESGMTLIEVMIALVLLVAISFMIYRTTTTTFAMRDRLLHDGDFYNGIRLAMGVIDRDVAMTYSPLLTLSDDPKNQGMLSGQPLTNDDQLAILGSDQGRVSSEFWMEAVHKNGLRPSRFQGTDQKLSFIALSNLRVYKDAKESEFLKVRYRIAPDDSPTPPGQGVGSTQMLIREVNPNAFDDDERTTSARASSWKHYEILRGIKKFAIRYYRADKLAWQTSWDSDNGELKYKFPDMIEVTLEVIGPSRLQFDGVYRFRPEVPLRGIPQTY